MASIKIFYLEASNCVNLTLRGHQHSVIAASSHLGYYARDLDENWSSSGNQITNSQLTAGIAAKCVDFSRQKEDD